MNGCVQIGEFARVFVKRAQGSECDTVVFQLGRKQARPGEKGESIRYMQTVEGMTDDRANGERRPKGGQKGGKEKGRTENE